MGRSLIRNYEEIQYQCQHHTSHWKSLWHGPEVSPAALFNNFLERIVCEALVDHDGSVSIAGRLITNFRFADDIVVNAEEKEKADVLLDRLATTNTRYKVEIVPWSRQDKSDDKQPKRLSKRDKDKRSEAKAVDNFKYLWSIISSEGSNPRLCPRSLRQQQFFLDWRSHGGARTSGLLLKLSWCGRYLINLSLCLWELEFDIRTRKSAVGDFWIFPTMTMCRTRRFTP